MRCFVAVDIPEEIKERILPVQKELKELDTKLVERENLHFTLKFLGKIDKGKMNAAMNMLGEIKMPAFTVNLKGIGFFPSSDFIRVAWIGSISKEFANLHNTVNDLLAGIVPKEKPVPHLTIARVRSQKFRKYLLDFQKRHEREEFGKFEVAQIKLKSSVVTGKGPIYKDIGAWNL
jgi:2'-5' RNA ligase